MKILAIAAVMTAALSGCVVAPVDEPFQTYGGAYAYGPSYVGPTYLWEPSVSLWYTERGGHRYYQPHGWSHPQYGPRPGPGFHGGGGFHGHQ